MSSPFYMYFYFFFNLKCIYLPQFNFEPADQFHRMNVMPLEAIPFPTVSNNSIADTLTWEAAVTLVPINCKILK